MEQYALRIMNKEFDDSMEPRVKKLICKDLDLSEEIDIPIQYRTKSLINNGFAPAKYLYSRGKVYVMAEDGAIMTCYPFSKKKMRMS